MLQWSDEKVKKNANRVSQIKHTVSAVVVQRSSTHPVVALSNDSCSSKFRHSIPVSAAAEGVVKALECTLRVEEHLLASHDASDEGVDKHKLGVDIGGTRLEVTVEFEECPCRITHRGLAGVACTSDVP